MAAHHGSVVVTLAEGFVGIKKLRRQHPCWKLLLQVGPVHVTVGAPVQGRCIPVAADVPQSVMSPLNVSIGTAAQGVTAFVTQVFAYGTWAQRKDNISLSNFGPLIVSYWCMPIMGPWSSRMRSGLTHYVER